jgi:hypothetical protein
MDIVGAGGEAGAFAEVDADFVGRLLFAANRETADAVAAGSRARTRCNALEPAKSL